MQKFHLILILILTISCTQTNNRITEFEKVLGERQTNALNLLVSDFEKNLTKIYPNLTCIPYYDNDQKQVLRTF